MSKPLIAFLGMFGLVAIATTFLSVNRSELTSPYLVDESTSVVSPTTSSLGNLSVADQLTNLGYLGSDNYDGNQRGPTLKAAAVTAGSALPTAVGQDSSEPAIRQPAAIQLATGPKLVWNGNLQIEVDDPRAAGDKLRGSVEGLGGYVASLNEYSGGLNLQLSMMVRIPTDKLDTALISIGGLGKVLQRSLNSQDVTLRYSDLDSRIRNLHASQERLLAHLSASNAIETTLQVEKELTRVLENLEVLQGQMNALSDQIDYATITVQLSSTPQAGSVLPYKSFSTAKTATDAARALSAFTQDLWTFAIWVGVWSPIWLPLALIGWFISRRRRNFANKQTN